MYGLIFGLLAAGVILLFAAVNHFLMMKKKGFVIKIQQVKRNISLLSSVGFLLLTVGLVLFFIQ